MTNSLGGAVPLFDKRTCSPALQSAVVDPHQACRKLRTRTTSTLCDKQDTHDSHSNLLKTMCLQYFQCLYSCLTCLINSPSFIFEQLTDRPTLKCYLKKKKGKHKEEIFVCYPLACWLFEFIEKVLSKLKGSV